MHKDAQIAEWHVHKDLCDIPGAAPSGGVCGGGGCSRVAHRQRVPRLRAALSWRGGCTPPTAAPADPHGRASIRPGRGRRKACVKGMACARRGRAPPPPSYIRGRKIKLNCSRPPARQPQLHLCCGAATSAGGTCSSPTRQMRAPKANSRTMPAT